MAMRSQPLFGRMPTNITSDSQGREHASGVGTDVYCRPDPTVFEDAVENSHDCIALVDVDGNVSYMNFSGLCQLGVDGTLPRDSWSALWSGESVDLIEYGLESARSGRSCRIIAHRVGARGDVQWWDIAVSPVFDRSGNPVQMFCVCRDVSEAKRLECSIENATVIRRVLR